MFLDRGGFQILPEGKDDGVPMQAQSLGESHARHMRNFLDCVKSRQEPISDIEKGHRSTSTAILGNVAYRTGKPFEWDAENLKPKGAPEAERYIRETYRKGWEV